MKKLQLYAMLLFVCSIMACKKEKANNPDIDDVILDFSIENKNILRDTIFDYDFNNDGGRGFGFQISHPNDDANQHYIELRPRSSDYQFLINEPEDYNVIKRTEKGKEIKPSDVIWKSLLEFVFYKYEIDGATVYNYGFSDIGDQYIAFRKMNSGGGYNYGWMLVNIERGEKFTIKEYALHKIADTPIKAGEK